MKAKNSVGQHDLPRTYLKRFAIDPNNRKLKSLVFCHWENEYESKIDTVSIDSDKFKKDDFYTIENEEDPYAFEKMFRDKVEPLYNKIMVEIENEKNLSFDCRVYMILWLYFNKYRNEAQRNNLEGMANFLLEVPYMMEHGKEKFEKVHEDIRRISKHQAKKHQLDSLINQELLATFDKGMGVKHWKILKSKPDNLFLTNDDPGFSIDIEMDIAEMNSLNSLFATRHSASNYFVLSPKYCLLISPFQQGTPMDISIHNQEIKFKEIDTQHINFINDCTKNTRTKYLISNSKDLIINTIKNDR